MLGRSASPTSGTYFAESGQLSHFVRPTSFDPAPMANRISVVVGFSETIRTAGVPTRSVSSKSSMTRLGPRVEDWPSPFVQPMAAAHSATTQQVFENTKGILPKGKGCPENADETLSRKRHRSSPEDREKWLR